MTTLVPAQKHKVPIEGSKEHLEISTSYNEGGTSNIAGHVNRRGLYVHFTRMERFESGGVTFNRMAMMAKGNFKVFVLPLSRRSSHKHNRLNAFIDRHKDELGAAWLAENQPRIVEILAGFAG